MGTGVKKLIAFVKVVNTSKNIKSRHGRCGVIVEKTHKKNDERAVGFNLETKI